ncbi:DUF6537 domain-containing protein [Sphingobium terrigena]|uniref:DUF6537 domain-containing protein n=1 Tax=Sphingobium terrigena TaxID=2304063 RepID=UPI001600C148|nr:DUF6537 domain-containing protein [Sphingobium terrigena]
MVTISNLIGAAAQAEGKSVQALDLTGLAQKFGAVYCHLKVADNADQLRATRLSVGQCDLLIGADLVTAASDESLSRLRSGATVAVVNDHATVTGAFTRDRDFTVPVFAQRAAIERFCGAGRVTFIEATELAEQLTGNTIGANIMLLGFTCQMGWLPVGHGSLEQAIESNGVAVPANLQAFALGRMLAHDPAAVTKLAEAGKPRRDSLAMSETVDELVERRRVDLVAYQGEALAARFLSLVESARQAEKLIAPLSSSLTEAVARNFYKLLAYKDEYEVARLFSDGTFLDTLKQGFSGDYTLRFHMAPPIFSKLDPATSRPRKREFKPWMLYGLRFLSKFNGLRGTVLDPFGYSEERRAERALIERYEMFMRDILGQLSVVKFDHALALARWPQMIRGYGPVKTESMIKADLALPSLRAAFDANPSDYTSHPPKVATA